MYIYDRNDKYHKIITNEINEDTELMILSFYNINHFDFYLKNKKRNLYIIEKNEDTKLIVLSFQNNYQFDLFFMCIEYYIELNRLSGYKKHRNI